MEPSCPLGTTRCIPQEKFHQKPYNKSFIDQVCSVKMAAYWPRSVFASLCNFSKKYPTNELAKKAEKTILPETRLGSRLVHHGGKGRSKKGGV